MDLLFNKAQRQHTSLSNDLLRFTEQQASASITPSQQGTYTIIISYFNILHELGQFMAGLTALAKTLNDLEEMVKREVNMEKKTAYKDRLSTIKKETEVLKARFNEMKQAQRDRDKQQLLATTGSAYRGATPSDTTSSQHQQLTEALLREKESRTLDTAGTRMDEMLFLGQSTLESLRSQRGILKSTHRRLLDGLTHMGVSKNIIRVIERKSAQDKWIFWGGVCLTLTVIYMCWKYFSS